MKLSLVRIGLVVLVSSLLFLVNDAKAQSGTSTIRGEVSDPQGKVISGAEVTLKSPNTGTHCARRQRIPLADSALN